MGADISTQSAAGWSRWDAPIVGSNMDGVMVQANNNNNTWCYSLTQINDGSSNTVLLGEVTGNNDAVGLAYTGNNPGTNYYGIKENNRFPIWAGGNPQQQGQGAQHNYFRVMDVTYPLNLKNGPNTARTFGSAHTGGSNFLFADGTVRFLEDGIDGNIYRGLGTRSSGESVSPP
jgi:prepilin-type processing-associated H-X9-DG protein